MWAVVCGTAHLCRCYKSINQCLPVNVSVVRHPLVRPSQKTNQSPLAAPSSQPHQNTLSIDQSLTIKPSLVVSPRVSKLTRPCPSPWPSSLSVTTSCTTFLAWKKPCVWCMILRWKTRGIHDGYVRLAHHIGPWSGEWWVYDSCEWVGREMARSGPWEGEFIGLEKGSYIGTWDCEWGYHEIK